MLTSSRYILFVFAIQLSDSLALQADGPKKTKLHHAKKDANSNGAPEVLATRVEQPTGRPDKNETAAEATGVAQNAAGDLDAFIAALIVNIVTICVMWIIASFLRQRYPLVYSKNALTLKDVEPIKEQYAEVEDEQVKEVLKQPWQVKVHKQPSDTLFGWWSASAAVTIDEVIKFRGMDIAMLLEFSHVAMKITAIVGLPLVLLVGPCHCFLGGYRAGAPGTADADYLSYWGMANVVDGHAWLYWAHALIMWLVIVTVQRMLYNAMRDFLDRRKKWLQEMPTLRATTVLVEGIPEKSRSDDALKKFFNEMFVDKGDDLSNEKNCVVKEAHVIKDTGNLRNLAQDRDTKELDLEKAKKKLNSAAEGEEKTAAQKVKDDAEKAVGDAKELFKAEQDKVLKEPIGKSKAFVTFKTRRDAELAKMIAYTPDAAEYVVEIPPEPTDVLWADLQMDPFHAQITTVVGYALIAGVFWAYLPTVVAIAYYTSLETLAEYSAAFKSMADDPATSALWDGMVNALALQLLMGFIPTFFMLIFSNFFCIKAGNSLQHKIQEWYFYFQVVFVLLVTAIGSSLLDTLEELAESPTSIVYLLASTLPTASHFYLNYLPLQWVTHAQNMLRTSNLFKFKLWSGIYGEAIAVKKAEPEDQDYYGLGSRSARFTFMLTLTLAFCSLSPLITILGFVNFWVCRKCYGYLCVFCETRKPDLGGYFYVSQLTHVSEGLFIYIILMTGVLLERDLTVWPGLIAASGLIFQYLSYTRFKTTFRWQNLCFEALKSYDDKPSDHPDLRESTAESYMQPVLATDELKSQLILKGKK